MTELQEQQKTATQAKATAAQSAAAAVAVAPEQVSEGASAAAGAQLKENENSIDVDVDTLVWEVETEHPADYVEETGEIDPTFVMGDARAPQRNTYDEDRRRDWDYYARPRYRRAFNKHMYTWLGSFFLGMYGVDRFFRGQIGLGILKLMTFGGFGFWYLADVIIAFYKSYVDTDGSDDLYFDVNGNFID